MKCDMTKGVWDPKRNRNKSGKWRIRRTKMTADEKIAVNLCAFFAGLAVIGSDIQKIDSKED